MAEGNLKKTIISSLFWKLLEQGGTQIVTFVVGIILARLLLPEDFGALALITVFIAFANIIIDGGFGTALVQKKNADDIDFSSIFYLSLIVASLCYVILYLISPAIADFYNLPILCPVIRVLGVTLFLGAINAVQRAYIQKNFLFKKLFTSSITAICFSSIVGLLLAFTGFGIWALVWQQITSATVLCITMFITVKWRPKAVFSITRTKSLFFFGGKLLTANIISTIYTQIKPMILGKYYSAEALGYYTRGYSIPQLISRSIVSSTIQAVVFPAFSNNQDKQDVVKAIMKRSMQTCAFLLYPCLFGIAAVAEPFVLFFLTEKWIPCIIFIQIFCIAYLFWPVHTVNNQATLAFGKSNIYLRNQILCLVLTLIAISITVQISMIAVAVGGIIVTSIISFLIMLPNRRLVRYRVIEQAKDLLPPVLLSAAMFACIYPITFLGLPAWLMLIIQIPLGVAVYFGLAKLFKVEALQYGLDTIKELLGKKTEDKAE